ncbi:hypothetical protein ACTOB_003089 [Actinoplanes oblitus]|uniref:Uncharacterized protein n=1 Tax=Actinoplanes oblitus TaxID=3040509 RepID=A0ABY8WPT0_9ACTN|nr:hypothetical protein [Actinoplanes oblitus]WIM99437.1 hypothetical protein ACTOB_003089 [Actinoplanes oblitus]
MTHNRTTKWQREQARLDTAKDDPNVCPPAIPGQLTLVRPRRHLTLHHAQRIHHRPVRGYNEAVLVIAAHASQHGLSDSWEVAVSRMVRLALAIRDADGDEFAGTDAVSDLPLFPAVVLEILDHATLLQPGATLGPHRKRQRSAALPQAVPPRPRNCASCLSWDSSRHASPAESGVGDTTPAPALLGAAPAASATGCR